MGAHPRALHDERSPGRLCVQMRCGQVNVVDETLFFVEGYDKFTERLDVLLACAEVDEGCVVFTAPRDKEVVVVQEYCLHDKVREHLAILAIKEPAPSGPIGAR